MAETNRHGLKRGDLREEVKRAVRQRCRFGCVVCGNAFVQYHHFDPQFEHATSHDPKGITLLCGGCHDKVTKGLWSNDLVRRQDRSPKGAIHAPHGLLDLRRPLLLIVGSIVCHDVEGVALEVDGEVLLALHQEPNEGVLLDARFLDETGVVNIEVRRNELIVCPDRWDVSVKGRRIRVTDASGKTTFDATLHPPHAFVVREMRIALRGCVLETDDGGRVLLRTRAGATIDLRDYCAVFGGRIGLEAEHIRLGPNGLIPFLGSRLRRLLRVGDIDQVLADLKEPVVHVVPFRVPHGVRPELAALRVDGAPSGTVRYRRLCIVCNVAPMGHRDLPEGREPRPGSDGICTACSKLPPDAWHVAMDRGPSESEHATRDEAIVAAEAMSRARAPSHVIVHGGGTAEWKMLYPNDTIQHSKTRRRR